MAFRRSRVAALCALFAASCSASTAANALGQIRSACNSGAAHVEAHLTGNVARVLGIRPGVSGSHEGFIFVTAGRPLKVEDNVDITGVIPLRAGDPVELLGQYECNDGVIHWTHRDPRGRHVGGYIRVHGQTYQ